MTEKQPEQAPTPQSQSVKEETKPPQKKWWCWCCGIPALLVVLALIGVTAWVLIEEKKQEDKLAKRNKPETYSEIFNANFAPDYTVSATDEEKFNQKMIDLLQKYNTGTANFSEGEGTKLLRQLKPDEKITKAKSGMKFLKDYYPEGYYLVVNSVLKTPEEHQIFPNFFLRSAEEEERIDLLVHELSHIGEFAHLEISGSSYVIEDKYITLTGKSNLLVGDELKKFLSDPTSADMPKGDELVKYIGEPASIDKLYLIKSKQDIYTTLDEIISYTKSVRVTRAYNYYKKSGIDESRPQALSRHLYYLSLHLKNIKENHPDKWQKLKKEKNLAYLLSRQVSIAKTEIEAAKDEGVSGSSGNTDFASSIDKNLSLSNENQALFDELFTAAGTNTLGNLQSLTQQELTKLNLKIEKF